MRVYLMVSFFFLPIFSHGQIFSNRHQKIRMPTSHHRLNGFNRKVGEVESGMVAVFRNELKGSCDGLKDSPRYGYKIQFGEIKSLRDGRYLQGRKKAIFHNCYEVDFLVRNCKNDSRTQSVIKHGILDRLNVLYKMRFAFKNNEAGYVTKFVQNGKEKYTGFQDFNFIKNRSYKFKDCNQIQSEGIDLKDLKEIYSK